MQVYDDVLKNIIIALLRKAGDVGLSKTKLIKLVFFTDLEASRQGQGPLTNCEYRTHTYGVVDFKIWDYALDELVDGTNIVYESALTKFGDPTYLIFLHNDAFGETPKNIIEITEIVWSKYSKYNTVELGSLTKEIVPMDDEWITDVLVDPRDIAYEESEEFQSQCRDALNNYPDNHGPEIPIDEFLRTGLE
jgi:uncharacterized phage-associated protein